MMTNEKASMKIARRIIWISDIDIVKTLHASSWLETTRYMREMGWELHLLTASEYDGVSSVRGVEFLSFKKPETFFVKQLIYHWQVFRWYLKNFNDGSIFLFHEISGIWCRFFQLWCKLNRRPMAFVMDTRTLPMEPETNLPFKTRLRRFYLRTMDRQADVWFDGRTLITKAMAESLEVPPEKVWAIWTSGVNLDLFRAVLKERKFPTENEPIRLIYVGTMHVERNLMTMCQAVVKANQAGCHFEFILVGDGNQYAELAAFAQDHPSAVRVHPPVPQEEIPAWLADAHIGVLPFPDEEKFRVSSPIKLFEYMAAGLPILATKIRCHTDVISSDDIVFWSSGSTVTDFLDTLKAVESHRDQLRMMGDAANLFAGRFTWQQQAQALSDGLLLHVHPEKSGE